MSPSRCPKAKKITYATLMEAQQAAVVMHWLYRGDYEPYPCGSEMDHYHLRSVSKRIAKEQARQRAIAKGRRRREAARRKRRREEG